MEGIPNSRSLRLARQMILALLIAGTAPILVSQTIVTFDAPNSTSTHPTAINLRGAITGGHRCLFNGLKAKNPQSYPLRA